MSEYELSAAPKQRGCLQKLVRGVGVAILVILGLSLLGVIIPSLLVNSSPSNQGSATALTYDQAKSQAIQLDYEALGRNTEQYIGRYVWIEGEIIQVIEEGNDYTVLLNMTRKSYGWDDTIMVTCINCSQRPLQGDTTRFVAQVKGRYTYQTVLGASMTVPLLNWL